MYAVVQTISKSVLVKQREIPEHLVKFNVAASATSPCQCNQSYYDRDKAQRLPGTI